MTSGPAALTVKDLTRAFRDVGLSRGDNVIVHSSYRSLVKVEGGPETVIQTLLDLIGPNGNLMLPTFNYAIHPPETFFNPGETPARTGIISEMSRKRPDAVRSLHPTHSVSVIGPDAVELTRDHLKVRAMGIDCPIDKLAKRDGKVLLIGVGNITNSMIHVGEEYAGIPKAPWHIELPILKIDTLNGNITTHKLDTSPSCSSAFGAVDYCLRRKSHINDLRLGVSKLQLMRGQDVINCVCEMIRGKPDILFCTWQGCKPCTGARENLRKKGLIR